MGMNSAPIRARQATVMPNVTWQSAWSLERILVLLTLGLFTIYGTFRAFENTLYDTTRMTTTFAGQVMPHYLSPFYSPPIQNWVDLPFGLSAALFLLAFPGSFRATCYFCRRTYYRAVFGSPPACAAREVMLRSTRYTGEKETPLLLQNLHRYTLYAILIFVAFHLLHLFQAFLFRDATGATRFGIGVGTLIFALDTLFLSAYVVSCHSFRHLIGGLLNRFSANPTRHRVWAGVSKLNARHGLFFWLSLISVGLADLYARCVCAGIVKDLSILF
jgi:hypothetical protein